MKMTLKLEGFTEKEVLGYVLVGLEAARCDCVAAIQELEARIGVGKRVPTAHRVPAALSAGAFAKAKIVTPKPAKTGRKPLSKAARQRIADAQHKRWAAVKRAKKQAARVATKGARMILAEPEVEVVEVAQAAAE